MFTFSEAVESLTIVSPPTSPSFSSGEIQGKGSVCTSLKLVRREGEQGVFALGTFNKKIFPKIIVIIMNPKCVGARIIGQVREDGEGL